MCCLMALASADRLGQLGKPPALLRFWLYPSKAVIFYIPLARLATVFRGRIRGRGYKRIADLFEQIFL